ncbi:DUF2508 family protein [Clostridium sp. D2Q-11]|uniref:DUF2508 family protein n=1 Tax=Anaeromonas frigoriresistens TaxID=2683708 RepID=A0A942USV0_9FIRM|nr:DUF2508 family protein [Anaeromonas frigoriresistens]MBS4537943.1 DUF2508 family protein [Anaeromonas frigoriresistens]
MKVEETGKIFGNKGRIHGIRCSISRFLKGMRSNMEINNEMSHEEEMDNLKQAHKEWRQAELYFQNVTDTELIDHAIYNMEAAKKKYFYLLNQVREKVSHENA